MGPLGLKARVDSLNRLGGGIPVTRSFRFTSGETPADLLTAIFFVVQCEHLY